MSDLSFDLWALFASAFISSTIAPGGSEAVLAYMVASGHHTASNLVIIATVGNTLGALTTWMLGWLTAKKFPLDQSLQEKHQKSVQTIKRWGIWALLFSWLPVVGDGLCFAGGWLKLTFWPGCLLIFIGKATRYLFVAYVFS